MILLGKDFLSLVQSCKIKPAVKQYTDHQSVVLIFRSGVSEKGRGYWKINNSVIQEYDYKIRLACVLSFLRHVNCCLFSLYIHQTSINLLVFIKDFKLFTDCLQTLPVRKA
jgi:hypothetical protein